MNGLIRLGFKAGYLSEHRLTPPTWTFLAGTAITSFGTGLALPYLAIYFSDERLLSPAEVAFLYATLGVISLLVGAIGGLLVDRIGPWTIGASGAGLQCLGFLLLSMTADVPTLFIAMVILGIGNGLFFPARTPIVVSLVAAESRTRVYSLRFLANNLGVGIGGFSAGVILLSTVHRLEILLVLNAMSFALFAVILLCIAPRTTSTGHIPARPDTDSSAVDSPNKRMLLGPISLLILSHTLTALFGATQIDTTIPLALRSTMQLEVSQVGILIGGISIFAAVAQLPLGKVVEIIGNTRALALQAGLWTAAWVLGLTSTMLAYHSIVVAVALLALVGLAECLFNPALNGALVQLSPPGLLGRINGLISSSYSGSLAWGPSIGFLLLNIDDEAFWCMLTFGMAGSLCCNAILLRRAQCQANT